MNELIDILEETEGKVIIWANYQLNVSEIIETLKKKFGEQSYVHYYGLTPQEARQSSITRFQTDPECRFLVGTPQTGGYGITLTQANTVIYYSNGYDLEKKITVRRPSAQNRTNKIGNICRSYSGRHSR